MAARTPPPRRTASQTPRATAPPTAGRPRRWAWQEQQILARVIQIISGPGGLASFLRRNLLGKPLAGPSLPLDVGQTDEIPVHLRRLVALRIRAAGSPADTSSKHTLTARARCRLVRRVCRYII